MSRNLKIMLAIAMLALGVSLFFQLTRTSPQPLPQLGMSESPCKDFDRAANGARARYDWAENCRFAAANAALIETGQRPELVMIGDSLTEYWKLSDSGIVQRGIAGQSSDHILQRFRLDVVMLNPAAVHILAGTNDIAGNTGPVTPDRVIGNIRSMTEIARANGITPIIATLPPASEFAWARHVPPNPWVDVLNKRIRALAEDEGLTLADYHKALTARSQGTFDQSLFDDGAHPNKEGYAVMRPVLDSAREAARVRDN